MVIVWAAYIGQRLPLSAAGGPPALVGKRRFAARALVDRDGLHQLLERTHWLLQDPAVPVSQVQPSACAPAAFAVVRDDLTHPLLGGNKQRKLDGLWPQLAAATDVVTCGGLQSMHALAVAAACAERGKRCHLLVRGERPAVPTGPHLYARQLAHRVTYVSRADYADRQQMFASYLRQLAAERQQQGPQGGAAPAGAATPAAAAPQGVAVIPEGAAEPAALLGLIRQVAWLAGSPHSPLASSASSSSSSSSKWHLVVDSGTGATATGLALGAVLLGLPWRVTGVMLAGSQAYYEEQQRALCAAFAAQHGAALLVPAGVAPGSTASARPEAAAAAAAALEAELQRGVAGRLRWAPRPSPRKFGKLLPGDAEACRAVAQQHGILLDPVWTLAAWQVAAQLAADGSGSSSSSSGGGGGGAAAERVAMVHTGGALGLCSLAQRWPDSF